MFDNPDQAAAGLARWAEDLERKAQRYQALHGKMATLTVTESSDGNRVSITVDSNGVPTDIRLNDGIRSMSPAALSSELMSVLHRAQAKLRREVTTVVDDMVGDDEVGAQIVTQYTDRFPDDSDTPPDGPGPNASSPGPAATPGPFPTPGSFQNPAPPPFPPPPATPDSGSGAGRGRSMPDTVGPSDPDDDEGDYFRRKSWLV